MTSTTFSLDPTLRLPPPVLPGDRVGVAALSGAVDPAALERGIAALEALGFEVVRAANLGLKDGIFAGSDRERLEGLHRLAADPTIKAVLFARGGHGVLRVLPGVDWDLLSRHPRAYVGYSDLVPFLLEVVYRLGWVSFHGPMVASDLGRGLETEERESFLAAMAGRYPQMLPLAGHGGGEGNGVVEGPLLGGCLSLLTATQGTPFAPRLAGAVVFWEEVNEPYYRIDRMLTHLRLSSSLAQARAMIVGQVVEGAPAFEAGSAPERQEALPGESLWREPVERLARELGWPFAWGLPCGHGAPNLTLPLGLTARLDGCEPAGAPRLTLGQDRESPGAQQLGS